MLISKLLLPILFSFYQVLPHDNQAHDISLEWSELPPIPDPTGFNGAFVGVHDGVLIFAGGANYPGKPVWAGGAKQWYDDIYVLSRDSDASLRWRTNPEWKLPRALATGIAIETTEGIVCIGGSDGDRAYADVMLLRWDPKKSNFSIEEFPPLPVPLTMMGGDIIDSVIYVVGGMTDEREGAGNFFFSLDLSKRDTKSFEWVQRSPLPGLPRVQPVVIAQAKGNFKCLFVFGGRNFQPGDEPPIQILSDAFLFNPQTGVWVRINDIPENRTPGIQGGSIEAAPAIATGRSEILVLGGVGGPNQHLMERMAIAHRAKELKDSLKTVSDAAERKAIEDQIAKHQQRLTDLIKKTSFSKRIVSYNTETDSWRNAGILPGQSQAVTRAVYFEGGIVIPGGEVGPGVRTNSVILGRISE